MCAAPAARHPPAARRPIVARRPAANKCDQCRNRGVRSACKGAWPCEYCATHGIECTGGVPGPPQAAPAINGNGDAAIPPAPPPVAEEPVAPPAAEGPAVPPAVEDPVPPVLPLRDAPQPDPGLVNPRCASAPPTRSIIAREGSFSRREAPQVPQPRAQPQPQPAQGIETALSKTPPPLQVAPLKVAPLKVAPL
ncbi:hypothetical protein FRC10_010732 [Ceratobasidium sp. 414]|nr:hypothetical protein FRC10_010732 [Ceratobasidium sp. 414]